MNCSQTNSRLVAYLGGEITASEKAAIQTHLAGCASCQGELESLSRLETRLVQQLNLQAESVGPAPQAWSTLQGRISHERPGGIFGDFPLLGLHVFVSSGLRPADWHWRCSLSWCCSGPFPRSERWLPGSVTG